VSLNGGRRDRGTQIMKRSLKSPLVRENLQLRRKKRLMSRRREREKEDSPNGGEKEEGKATI